MTYHLHGNRLHDTAWTETRVAVRQIRESARNVEQALDRFRATPVLERKRGDS